ncbi:MAG: hypothetical protein ACF8XB_14170 [Planctomycetota bacterium JB042]
MKAENVEHAMKGSRGWRSVDHLGFGDVEVYGPGVGVGLVQTTSADNVSARRRKIQAEPRASDFLGATCPHCRKPVTWVVVQGWRDDGRRRQELAVRGEMPQELLERIGGGEPFKLFGVSESKT